MRTTPLLPPTLRSILATLGFLIGLGGLLLLLTTGCSSGETTTKAAQTAPSSAATRPPTTPPPPAKSVLPAPKVGPKATPKVTPKGSTTSTKRAPRASTAKRQAHHRSAVSKRKTANHKRCVVQHRPVKPVVHRTAPAPCHCQISAPAAYRTQPAPAAPRRCPNRAAGHAGVQLGADINRLVHRALQLSAGQGVQIGGISIG